MSEAADLALIGRRVAGKFVVERFLGGGAMGAVYRARDDSLERNVALKVMHPTFAVDPSFVSRFHREARAASRLDHPNSMRVIEFGAEPDGLLYIAMEYLEGRELYKVIHEDWPLPDTRIADVMMKALAAIAVAHDMGVIHRDLKPENIMILDRKDDEGRDIVKVCDFGIAKITETEKDPAAPNAAPKTAGAKLTTAGLVVGTPEYMSPEQARGEKLDARSDLYSMGIILYQLLTGRTPFLGETALAVVLKHITEAPEAPNAIYPGVHKGLEAVCLRAIIKAKEERFQSARDMRAALKAVIDGRPIPVDANTVTGAAVSGVEEEAVLYGSGPPAGPGPPISSMSSSNAGVLASASAEPGRTSKTLPLGTTLGTSEQRRSRAPLFIGVALSALVIGGVGVVLAQKGQAPNTEPVVPTESESATAIKLDVKAASAPASGSAPSASPSDPKRQKHPPAPPKAPNGADHKTASIPTSAPSAELAPAPMPALPDPQPTAAPTSQPAPAPVFSPASCRATLGAPRSASAYNAKDLALHGTDAAWTSCAKSSIKERPAGAISGTVRIRFNDNKVFRGATCNGCTPALAQCIASSTGKTASVSVKAADPMGDPEFDVPVTFSCE